MTRSRPKIQHTHYDVDATITPETGFKMSLVQLLGVVGAVFVVAVGYAYLVWGVADIKDTQSKMVVKTAEVIATQDSKREDLGKKFLDSNERIAAAVSTLATQMAVQQERQKSTDEKLEKVLTQISTTLTPPPPRR